MITMSDCPVSCGVKILGGETQYQTAEVYIKDFLRVTMHVSETQFIFTHCLHPLSIGRGAKRQDDGRVMGEKIEEYIKNNGLGEIVRSHPGGNPHHPQSYANPDGTTSKHEIVVWVWTCPKSLRDKHRQFLAEKAEAEKAAAVPKETNHA